jgi:carboxyl-terminal processing protease
VAAEIIRLKQDSIEGLILDLRFNGGGSMREAIGVAGLFVNEGPIAIYHPKNETPFILKDANRGTVWDGPLLVLINGASASASEFVAAALQDYGRAIIAGSPSFGKGTAQNLLPADTNDMASVYSGTPNAVMKITGGKFYRLTGGSLQGKGIAPDVTIPGVLEHVIEREAQLPFYLPSDSVAKAAPHAPASVPGRTEVLARSMGRQAQGTFGIIRHLGDSLRKASYRTERVALGFEDYRRYSSRQKLLSMRAEKLHASGDPSIAVLATRSSLNVMEIDSFFRARHHRSMTALKADIVFHESVRILSDMIDLLQP